MGSSQRSWPGYNPLGCPMGDPARIHRLCDLGAIFKPRGTAYVTNLITSPDYAC